MKEIVRITILLFVLIMFVFFLWEFNKHNNNVTKRLESIPNFTCKTLKSITFTEDDLSVSLPKLLIYINSECEFCNDIAKQVYDNLEQLKKMQIIFISYEKTENIERFAEKHNLSNKENILFLMDYDMSFSKIIDAQKVPYILLYDRENSLVKNFKGSSTISKIIKFLN